jgi:hypothetical protein
VQELAAVSFPDELQPIGYQAFEDCSHLKQLYLDQEMYGRIFRFCRDVSTWGVSTSKMQN